ncbi:MAG: OmpA family protein [Desulfobacteraceae bacterium]
MKKNISLLLLIVIALGTSGYSFFLYREKTDLATRYKNQQRELQALESRKTVLHSLKGEKNDLAEKFSALKRSQDGLQAALQEKEQSVEELNQELAEKKQTIDKLKLELAEKKLALEQALETSDRKEKARLTLGKTLRERAGRLSAALDDKERQLATVEKARAGEKEQVEALQIAFAQEQGRLEHLEKSLASTRQALAEKEQELVQARQRISLLEEKIRSGEKAANRKAAEMKEEIDRLQAAVKEKQSRSGVLARRLKELKESEKSLQHRVDGQQNKVDQLVATMDTAQKKNQNLEDLIKKNQQLLVELKEELVLVQQAKKNAEKRINNLKKTHKNLIAKFQKQIQQKEMTITELRGELTVSIVDKILFPSGDSIVRSTGKEVLGNVSKILQKVGNKKIRVVGHTDSIPIGPRIKYKYQSNWELSAVRAASVVHVLERYLPPENLEVVGRSFHDPLASNETQEGKARNRRVEIILAPQLTP